MSSMGYTGKTTNSQPDNVGNHAQRAVEEQWGPIPGEVVSYDASKGTATIKPLYKPLFNGEPQDMPNLLEVPMELSRTGTSGLTMPIPPGTKVMLNPSMRSRESYDDANDGQPSDARSFHLADMRATITGGDSLTDPMQNVDADNVHLRPDAAGNFGLKASPDGKASLTGSQGEFLDLLTQVVEKLAADTLVIKYGSSAGSGHALQFQSDYAEIAGKLRAMVLS